MRTTKIIIYIVFHFCITKASAQAPVIQWQKSFGGTGADYAYSVKQTADGSYVFVGTTDTVDANVSGFHGGSHYWFVKTDGNGNILWQKCYGGAFGEVASDMQLTSDGGFIIAGWAWVADGEVVSPHGKEDYWIVKTDSAGNIQWQKCYGGTNTDVAYAIQQTHDGGYIVAGYSVSNNGDVTGNHFSSNDYWVVKLDTAGVIQWQKSLGGGNDDVAYAVQQTTDKGYIVAGRSKSLDGDVTGNHGDWDYWVVKLDSAGTLQWQKSLGGTGIDEAQQYNKLPMVDT